MRLFCRGCRRCCVGQTQTPSRRQSSGVRSGVKSGGSQPHPLDPQSRRQGCQHGLSHTRRRTDAALPDTLLNPCPHSADAALFKQALLTSVSMRPFSPVGDAEDAKARRRDSAMAGICTHPRQPWRQRTPSLEDGCCRRDWAMHFQCTNTMPSDSLHSGSPSGTVNGISWSPKSSSLGFRCTRWRDGQPLQRQLPTSRRIVGAVRRGGPRGHATVCASQRELCHLRTSR